MTQSEPTNFDLVHICRIIAKKKKFVFGLTGLVVLVGLIFCLVSPKRYTSQTIFIVKNPLMMDRNFVFRDALYEHKEFFAVPDDIDQVEAIAKSDALLWHLINKFKLDEYYGISNFGLLKRRVKMSFAFSRKDTKNIEMFYTDSDPKMAHQVLAEAKSFIEKMFLDYFVQNNRQIATTLTDKLKELDNQIDSVSNHIVSIRTESGLNAHLLPTRGEVIAAQTPAVSPSQQLALEQLQNVVTTKDELVADRAKMNSLLNELSVFTSENVNIFYVVQDAYEPNIDDNSHPKTWLILAGCLIGGFIVSVCIAVFGAFYKEKVVA